MDDASMANSVSSGQECMTLMPEWLSDPLLQQLFELARKCGGEGRIVGGAVRDPLSGRGQENSGRRGKIICPRYRYGGVCTHCPISDAARAAGLAVYETGLVHGTVTIGQIITKSR